MILSWGNSWHTEWLVFNPERPWEGLHPGKSDTKHQSQLGTARQSSSLLKPSLSWMPSWVWASSALITNKTKCTVSNTNWLKVASRWKEYFIPLCSAPVRPYLDHSTLLAQPVQKGCWETGTHPPESQLSRERDLQGELRKLDLFSLAQRSLVWSKYSLWLLEGAYRDAGAEVFLVMSDNAMGQCLKSDALRLRLEPQS